MAPATERNAGRLVPRGRRGADFAQGGSFAQAAWATKARRDGGHGVFLMRNGAVCRELVATARHDGVDVFPVGTQDTADLGRRGPLGEPRDHFRDLVPLFAPT